MNTKITKSNYEYLIFYSDKTDKSISTIINIIIKRLSNKKELEIFSGHIITKSHTPFIKNEKWRNIHINLYNQFEQLLKKQAKKQNLKIYEYLNSIIYTFKCKEINNIYLMKKLKEIRELNPNKVKMARYNIYVKNIKEDEKIDYYISNINW